MDNAPAYAPWLWLLTFLFLLRVVGQLVAVWRQPRWLPPMAQWYSGLLPYRYLLPAQIAILALLVAIDESFRRGAGIFIEPQPLMGRVLIGLALIYWSGMAVRYLLRMRRQPDQRWLGGTIPIAFHCVLAAFLFLVGRYHAGQAP